MTCQQYNIFYGRDISYFTTIFVATLVCILLTQTFQQKWNMVMLLVELYVHVLLHA